MKLTHFNVMLCLFVTFISSSSSYSMADDSLTLTQVIQQVMINHPLIEQAQQRVRASQARLDQSRSRFYPELDAVGLYSRIDPVPTIDLPDQGSLSMLPENSYDVHLQARQTIFDFGRRANQRALARSDKQSAEDGIEHVKSKLAFETVRTFYTILFLQEDIRVLDEEINALNEHLSITEKKAQTGSATDLAVLTTRVRVANARSEKVDVESELKKQNIVLKRLMGVPLDQDIHLKGHFTSQDVRIDPDSLASTALAQRREMVLAQDAEAGLEIRRRLEALGDKPSLSASLSLGARNGYFPDLNEAKLNWIAGVEVQIPLFNGFQTRYQKEEADADLAAARAHTRNVSRQIDSEVKQALADIRAKQEKIRASELQLEQAKQALSLAQTQYKIGAITNLDLLDAETSHLQANLTHLRALYEMTLSRYALEEAAGSKIW
jgi:outer membrane protein